MRFDARGFGGSPPGDGLLTMERIADDAAALLDHLGIAAGDRVRRCRWAATPPSRSCAATPTRLRGLVLADTQAPADTDRGAADAAPTQADKVRREGPAAIADGVPAEAASARPRTSERPQVVARVREMILASARRAASRTRWPAWPRARTRRRRCARSACPTLVVCGAEDALTPVADAEAIHAAIPGSRLELIPKAGHLASVETPEAFNKVLEAFLRQQG